MSSAAVTLPHVRAREEARTDDALEREARSLLAGGPVCFKLSSRVDTGFMPRWKRRLYVYFCREAPPGLKVPPRPAEQLDVWTSFAAAVRECKTPDDQLLAMPLNRRGVRGAIVTAVECRPRDPSDAVRFETLRAVFAGYGGEDERLEDLAPAAERLIEKCRHV